MGKAILLNLILIIALSTAVTVSAFEQGGPAVEVIPEFSDRLFPYIAYRTVWKGTPVFRHDVAVPDAVMVFGEKEETDIVSEAGNVAFFLGNWAEDIGFSVENVIEKKMPRILIREGELPKTESSNLIVVGRENDLRRRFGLEFKRPSVIYREAREKKLLFVGGATKEESIRVREIFR